MVIVFYGKITISLSLMLCLEKLFSKIRKFINHGCTRMVVVWSLRFVGVQFGQYKLVFILLLENTSLGRFSRYDHENEDFEDDHGVLK